MNTGPSQNTCFHESQELENTTLLEKFQSGKMETGEKPAGKAGLGYLVPEDMIQAFHVGFFDEEVCRQWILTQIHPKGPLCPGCGHELQSKNLKRYWENKRIICPECGKWFTALTGTMFQSVHMGFREIVLLMLFLGIGLPDMTIAGFLGGTKGTVRRWRRRFELTRKLINR